MRAGLVRTTQEYEWSSARAHLSAGDGDPLVDAWAWGELGLAEAWAQILAAGGGRGDDEELREATHGGLPFGDEGFVRKMERKLNRCLHRRPPGPQPKAARAAAG